MSSDGGIDITSLVRNWMQNSQNGNNGFIIINRNETSASDCFAFISNDHATVLSRPSVSMTYYYNEVYFIKNTVNVGEGKTMSLLSGSIPSGATVKWSSNDTSIATVDSRGFITGEKIGSTKITATITGGGTNQTATVNVNVVLSGIYFLKNRKSNKMLDIEGPSTAAGTKIHQWQFYGHDSQRWWVDYQSDGYYTIKSVHSGLYLSVENNSSATNARITQLADGTASGQRWKFTELSDGVYKITSKCGGINIAMSVDGSGNDNGNEIKNKTYIKDSNYQDEWIVEKYTFYYVNYFDSSLNETMQGEINTVVEFVDKVYNSCFGIKMKSNGSATRYVNAIADKCSHGINQACTDSDCGLDCDVNHHKNIKVISDQLYNSNREYNHLYVMWSDRNSNTYCNETNGVHKTVDWLAVVYNNRPVIHKLKIYGVSNNYKHREMCITLAHETAHTFGFHDVYDIPGHDSQDSFNCVMERYAEIESKNFYNEVSAGRRCAFCSSCVNELNKVIPHKAHYAN